MAKDILVSHKILGKWPRSSYLFFHLGSHIISFLWRRSISVRVCDFGLLRRVVGSRPLCLLRELEVASRGYYYCRVAVEKLAPESSALSGLLSAAVTTSVDKCKQKWDDGRKVETLEFHPIDTCSSFGGASIGPSDRVTRCPIQSRLQQKWNAAEPWWETPESE